MRERTLISTLASVPPFSALSADELASLQERIQQRAYRSGEVIYREGDPPAFVFYVLNGEVNLSLASYDRRISMGKFTGGRLLGIQTLFDDGPQFVSATTLTPVTVLAIPREELLQALRRHPDAILQLAAIFARQIRAAARLVAEIQFLNLPVRLAKRILERVEEAHGLRDPDGHLVVSVTQKELSELTGATRVGVNRALKRLEEMGVLRVGRGSLTILSPGGLRDLAEQEDLPMLLGLAPAATEVSN